ncbi:MAG: bifunctional phosphoglucose/phosphomannose isomerase [Candidatus Kapabacteria bacterium]|nr:bifunctional phosphoglucose/phosphomannose isomerase [Candidatus Kapabacteria bacterium]
MSLLSFDLDQSNMFQILKDFPVQVEEALSIGDKAPVFKNRCESGKFLALGMGGSAIGADLLRSFLSNTSGADHISLQVNRNYHLSQNLGQDTNVIISSYSGGTEETLSGFADGLKKFSNFIAITSGGELSRIAQVENIPVISIPGGLQPRCALGYSFFPLLKLIMKSGIIADEYLGNINNSIAETMQLLKDKSELYTIDSPENPAVLLAHKLWSKIIVVYSSSNILDCVNIRWRGQIQENAKNFAFGNFIPEMNHNEINSWSFPENLKSSMLPLIIRDKDDYAKNKKRFDAITSIFKENGNDPINIESHAESLLARIFDLIYLGDWTSYYLALLNGVDPTPIPLITKLKNYLAG